MRNFNTALLSALLIGWLFGGPWWYANNYRSVSSPNTNSNNLPFTIVKDGLQLKADDNFFFSKSSSEISVPQSTRLAFLDLIDHLNQDPNQGLKLIGNYFPSEINDSELANLGLARAHSLKEVLIAQGAKASQIKIDGLKLHHRSLQDNTLIGGVQFSFQQLNQLNQEEDASPAATSEQENTSAIKIESLNLYFTKSKYKIKMTPELDTYFDKLKKYLAYHPEAQLRITGHSDNLGLPKDNMRLSKYRARKVKEFMLKHGFTKDKLKISYKGSNEPIGDNSTKKGRGKNRRVELRIIE